MILVVHSIAEKMITGCKFDFNFTTHNSEFDMHPAQAVYQYSFGLLILKKFYLIRPVGYKDRHGGVKIS